MQLWHPDTSLSDSSPKKNPPFSIKKNWIWRQSGHTIIFLVFASWKTRILHYAKCLHWTPGSQPFSFLQILVFCHFIYAEKKVKDEWFVGKWYFKKSFYRCGLHLIFFCLMFCEVWFWMKICHLYNASGSLLSKMVHLLLVRLALSCKLNSKSKASVTWFLKA